MQFVQRVQQREGDHGGDLQERPGGGGLHRVFRLPAIQVWCVVAPRGSGGWGGAGSGGPAGLDRSPRPRLTCGGRGSREHQALREAVGRHPGEPDGPRPEGCLRNPPF